MDGHWFSTGDEVFIKGKITSSEVDEDGEVFIEFPDNNGGTYVRADNIHPLHPPIDTKDINEIEKFLKEGTA